MADQPSVGDEGEERFTKIEWPAFVPLPDWEITYNEWHAMELGVIPGITAGGGLLLELNQQVFYFTIALIAAAGLIECWRSVVRLFSGREIGPGPSEKEGEGEEEPHGRKVIKREPWYFLLVYGIAAAVTVTVGSGTWPL